MGNILECEKCFGSGSQQKTKENDLAKQMRLKGTNTKKDDPEIKRQYTGKEQRRYHRQPTKEDSDREQPMMKGTQSNLSDYQSVNKQTKKYKKLTIDDFTLIKVLGRGSFGKVYLVLKKNTKKYYALKALKKEDILSKNQREKAFNERNILQNAYHPFVVSLKYSFQNETTLYLVMDYLPGGELFTHLKERGRFDEETAKFYAAEVILALDYLHTKLKIIYRDLKPENILLDASGHIKLTDFGLSKATKKTFSFCGTPEYLAPEIVKEVGHDQTVDWWSLGCLIYEMLAGYPPFASKDKYQLANEILRNKPMMPFHLSSKARDLLPLLMHSDPTKRLGSQGADEIKNHSFFEGIDWTKLEKKTLRPPILPTVTKPDDVRNFDRKMVNEPAVETPQSANQMLKEQQSNFKDFTYIPKNEILGQSHVETSKLSKM